jgi:hypothetical protein
MWEFYLAGSEAGFRYGGLMVFQMQLAKKSPRFRAPGPTAPKKSRWCGNWSRPPQIAQRLCG